MRRLLGLCVALLAGCDQVFSQNFEETADAADAPVDACPDDPAVDLDTDCIADTFDACITPRGEAEQDEDEDGALNAEDGCVLDMVDDPDADGDGLGDACDPSAQPGGERRCSMLFSSGMLNALLWRDLHDTIPAWSGTSGALVHVPPSSPRLAVTLIERPLLVQRTTTLDVRAEIRGATNAGLFALWLDAVEQDEGEAEGAGCLLFVNNDDLTVRATGEGTETPVPVGPFAADMDVRVRGTYVVGVATQFLSCAAKLGDGAWVATGDPIRFADTPGRPGFGARIWPVQVTALEIFEHP